MKKAFSLIVPAAALAAGAILPAAGGAAPPPAAPLDGARLYQAKCGGCHSISANRVGPAHKGVFGRKSGMAPAYAYSPALRAAAITWNAATLNQWLQGPQKLVKGSKMFLSLPNPAERAAIIAYLQSEAAR